MLGLLKFHYYEAMKGMSLLLVSAVTLKLFHSLIVDYGTFCRRLHYRIVWKWKCNYFALPHQLPAPPTMATPTTTFLRQLQSTLRHSHFSFSNSHLVFSCPLPLRSWEDIMESVRKSFALKFSRFSETWIFVGGLRAEILSGKQKSKEIHIVCLVEVNLNVYEHI